VVRAAALAHELASASARRSTTRRRACWGRPIVAHATGAVTALARCGAVCDFAPSHGIHTGLQALKVIWW
jgi:hypothetical protein